MLIYGCLIESTAAKLIPNRTRQDMYKMKFCEGNNSRGGKTKTYRKKKKGKVVKQTEQTEGSKRTAEEGSVDKDRQKDRISLSHS